MRVKRLVDNRRRASKKNYFIIAESKESEDAQIAKIKLEIGGLDSDLMFTVFKLYD